MEEIIVNSYDDFEFVKEKFNKENFIFRGHSDKSYRLIPSLYRRIFNPKIDSDDERNELIKNIFFKEDDIFKMIKKYECKKNHDLNLSHLCKLQHYGVETRLLDFTKDIDIALEFALCDFYEEVFLENDKDACIIVLDKSQFTPEKENDEELLAQLIYNYNEDDCMAIEEEFVGMDDRIAEYPLKPQYYEYHGNELERIEKQKGCFILFPHAFKKNLEIEDDQIHAKFIIPKEVKKELYEHLKYKMDDLK